MENKNIALFLF